MVEDDPPIRQLIGDALQGAGYAVLAVGDGEEALALVREREVDAVVTDLMMPRRTGWSLVRALRETPSTRDLPVVVVSAFVPEGEVPERELPRVWVLVKPFEIDDLLACVGMATADGRG